MKADELVKVATCAKCRKKFGEARAPYFFRMRVQMFVINAGALRRHTGLEMATSPALARVMGPNEDLAEAVASWEVTLCADCQGEIPQHLEPKSAPEPEKPQQVIPETDC